MRLWLPSADRRLLDASKRQRVMRWVIAIMVFLTVLAAGLGLGMVSARSALGKQLAGRVTVQVVEADPAARDRDVAAISQRLSGSSFVRKVTPVDRARLAALVRPWLGQEGADPDLPIPALIDVDLNDASDSAVTAVRDMAKGVTPVARVERQAQFLSPVASFMSLMTWISFGLVALIAAATAAVVLLAARAGLDAHRDTITVLHMLGSTDVQVARLFQRRIGLEALSGGVVGTILAAGVVWLVGNALNRLGSDLLAGISIDNRDWVILGLIPFAFAVLATFAARLSVLGQLKRDL